MYKQIINTNAENQYFLIPPDYLNNKIEITIKKISEINLSDDEDVIQLTSGILKTQNIDPIVWQNNLRDEWNT